MDEKYVKLSDVEDVLKKAYLVIEDTYNEVGWAVGYNADDVDDGLSKIPTADVEPIVHGHNSGKDYAECDQFVCSKCGIELQGWSKIERDPDDGEVYHYEYTFKRCPDCGAKMDEENKQ